MNQHAVYREIKRIATVTESDNIDFAREFLPTAAAENSGTSENTVSQEPEIASLVSKEPLYKKSSVPFSVYSVAIQEAAVA
eukprot:9203-Rhodomonas_salina.1